MTYKETYNRYGDNVAVIYLCSCDKMLSYVINTKTDNEFFTPDDAREYIKMHQQYLDNDQHFDLWDDAGAFLADCVRDERNDMIRSTMKEDKRRPGRPKGSVQDVHLRMVKIRLDGEEYDYFKSWNPKLAASLRQLIKDANDKHRKSIKKK